MFGDKSQWRWICEGVGSGVGAEVTGVWSDTPHLLAFAGAQDGQPTAVSAWAEGQGEMPSLRAVLAGAEELPVEVDRIEGRLRVTIEFPAAVDPSVDDELVVDIGSQQPEILASARIVLRRSHCRLGRPLDGAAPATPQMEATLRWFGWNRCGSFTLFRSMSGFVAQAMVVQPNPESPGPEWDPLNVLGAGPGVNLLVKCARLDKAEEEWQRVETFLRPRTNPFVGLPHLFLKIQPSGRNHPPPSQGAILSLFLGGNVMNTGSLERYLRNAPSHADVEAMLGRLYDLLLPWHRHGRRARLGNWSDLLSLSEDGSVVFRGFDLRLDEHRQDFGRRVEASAEFAVDDAWFDGLVGREGLLAQLADVEVHFSLIHADLHPRNVLVHGQEVWLIDFGNSGVGPTLADYAQMEIFLRRWFLTPRSGGLVPTKELRELERTLLRDMVTGLDSLDSLAPVARALGLEAVELERFVAIVNHVRRMALKHGQDYSDRRGYLSVLYLSALRTLLYARKERAAARQGGYLWIANLATAAEEMLRTVFGLPGSAGPISAVEVGGVNSSRWILPPGAAARLDYLGRRTEGQQQLPSFTATRGLLQNARHHLDIHDHALLSLEILEGLLDDPLAGLADPAGLAARAEAELRANGLQIPTSGERKELRPASAEALQAARESGLDRRLARILGDHPRSLAKWSMVVQAVARAEVRQVILDPRSGRRQLSFRGFGRAAARLAHTDIHRRGESEVSGRSEVIERLLFTLEPILDTLMDGQEAPVARPDSSFALSVLTGLACTMAAQGEGSQERLGQAAEVALSLLSRSPGWRWEDIEEVMRRGDTALSRTARGESSTEASTSKRPLLLSGEELARQQSRNFERVLAIIDQLLSGPRPTHSTDIEEAITRLEGAVNYGLLPDGRLRTWDPSYRGGSAFAEKVAWAELPSALQNFYAELLARSSEPDVDPIVLSAWAEWSLNGPLHPFYDGCGRTSRAVGAGILLAFGQPPPLYRDRAEWFDRAFAGLPAFTDYLRERVAEARKFLDERV